MVWLSALTTKRKIDMLNKKILAAAIAAAITAAFVVVGAEDNSTDAAPAGKAASKPAGKPVGKASKKAEIDVETVIALCTELGPKVCRPILKEAGYASPKALGEAVENDEVEQEELEELYEALQATQEEEEEEEEAEIDVDTVKKAVQAFAKENGKAEADEILAEFDLTSVRSLNKLKPEQLQELYEAVTE